MVVFPAGLREGQEFFSQVWPEVRAVADEEGVLYQELGLSRASLREMLGPGVWLRALKTMRKGFSPSRPIGNPWLMPGVFLVRGNQILQRWDSLHIADNPDFSSLYLSLADVEALQSSP